jgi:hypothetical protein
MWNDPIVAEVRRIRAEHAARFHYDLEAIYRDLKEKERTCGRTYVRYPPRTSAPVASELEKQK